MCFQFMTKDTPLTLGAQQDNEPKYGVKLAALRFIFFLYIICLVLSQPVSLE